jgi:excisionase family DNA binding protein
MERLYTVPEAADVLRVTRAAIYKWIREKKLGVVYVGSERRITQSAIDAFIKESTDRRLAGGDTMDDESQIPGRAASLEPALA